MLIFQFTLPREERRQVQAQPLTLQNFNPRSHERSDHITQSFVFRFFNFNPRSHERSDVGCLLRLFYHLNFNPRSHERSDKPFIYKALRTIISIHAPTRGATMHQCRHSLQLSNFNPRSHERSDTSSVVAKQCDRVFQSTLPREERQEMMLCLTMM